MNKQQSGDKRGIEWCTHTWNPVQGCRHDCKWTMPDGVVAQCYAKTIAQNLRSDTFMPQGFEAHYFHPKRLQEPLSLKTPAKIFFDSFSDLMGSWVPDTEIEQVLDVCRKAHWHTFQLLTKNAPRLLKFKFPPNVWVGVSAPPSFMMGNQLSLEQQHRMVKKQLDTLAQIDVPVRWMSIEPLSFDIAPLLTNSPLEWAVIGAATNGNKTYQPEKAWVENVLRVLDAQGTKVFFKGNLEWQPWREDFPQPKDVPTVDDMLIDIQPQQTALFDGSTVLPALPEPEPEKQQRLIWDKRYDAGKGYTWVRQSRVESYASSKDGHYWHENRVEHIRLPKTSPIAQARARFLAGLKLPALREAYHRDFQNWQEQYVEIPDFDLSMHDQVDDRYLHFSYAANSVSVETVATNRVVPLVRFVQMGMLMPEVYDIAENGEGDVEAWYGMTTRSKAPYCLRFLGDERLFLIGGQHRFMALLLNHKVDIQVRVDRIPLTLEEARKGSGIKPPGLQYDKIDFDPDYWNIANVLEEAMQVLAEAREVVNA